MAVDGGVSGGGGAWVGGMSDGEMEWAAGWRREGEERGKRKVTDELVWGPGEGGVG